MSSSAGKFQDYYAILGVEPRADMDTIQASYTKLAQKFHPNNAETGDKEKFDTLNQAYEVLSDPALRAEFDKLKGLDIEQGAPKFSGRAFFEALGRDSGLRLALLCILYDRRRSKPFTPSISMRHVEGMLQGTTEELNFALWYLKQKNLAQSDDKSSLVITVEGMDYLEGNRPSPDFVMPFIKPGALAPGSTFEPPAPEPEATRGLDSLRRVMALK